METVAIIFCFISLLKNFHSQDQFYVPYRRTSCYHKVLKVTHSDLLNMAEIDLSPETKKPQQNYHNYKLHLKTTISFFVCVLCTYIENKFKHTLE